MILRASGTAISLNGALGVETFSRVASFASAFIPANLGALEASSLAAVAAVGAIGGGAALALARRLRGLFWAGVGLAIYPRRARTAPVDADAATARGSPAAAGDAALSAVRRRGRACRRPHVSPGFRSQSACCVPPSAPVTRA